MQIFIESNRIQIQLVIVNYKKISRCRNILNVNTKRGLFALFPHTLEDKHKEYTKKTPPKHKGS